MRVTQFNSHVLHLVRNSAICISVALLAGCAYDRTHPSFTSTKDASGITDAVRKYDMAVVFPFRQDIWIGDVLASATTYEQWQDTGASGVRVSRLDFSQDFDRFQSDSPSFTSTNTQQEKSRSFVWRGKTYQMRPVAAPTFAAHQGKKLKVGGEGSVALFSGWLGGSSSRQSRYTISVPEMITAGVPRSGAQVSMALRSRFSAQALTGLNDPSLAAATGCDVLTSKCNITVAVVLDVFMAKKIVIDVESDKSFGVGAGATAGIPIGSLTSLLGKRVQGVVGQSNQQVQNEVGKVLNDGKVPKELKTRIQNIISSSGVDTTKRISTLTDEALSTVGKVTPLLPLPLPGLGQLSGSVSASSYNGKSASVVIDLDEPVTIGYRGFVVQYQMAQGGKNTKSVSTDLKTPPPALPQ